jgi:DNA segregation ATPase FtsK/SpoIIIE, S-DNA-T family
MPRKKKKKQLTIHSSEIKILLGLLTLIGGVAITITPFADGEIFYSITKLIGQAAVVWGLLICFVAMRILFDKPYFNSWKPLIGLLLMAITASIFLTFIVPAFELSQLTDYSTAGGLFGYKLHTELFELLGGLIEFLIILLSGIISFSLLSGVSLEKMRSGVETGMDGVSSSLSKFKKEGDTGKLPQSIDILNGKDSVLSEKEYVGGAANKPDEIKIEDSLKQEQEEEEEDDDFAKEIVAEKTMFVGDEDRIEASEPTEVKDKDADPFGEPIYTNWQSPPSSIYQKPVKVKQDEKIHKRNAIVIEKTLRSFGIETRISKITIGPTVVQYALSITVGTKVSKIKNLSTDLALALATSETLVRIEAPIPGTSLIGIEIPNPTPNFVYIKDMVEDLQSRLSKFTLPIILGKNVANEPIIQELTTLPHLLVAGATGSGKSAGINSILTGLLMSKTPDELKLLLVDPKMVEMAPYNGIPYLLTPVVTDMELVINALQWSIEEMQRRYRMLKQTGVRNIGEYNKKIGYTAMPYLVIIIDEMADLMLTTGHDVETKIVRLAQMARAVGIHLILATQRPSVDVITGLIKANIPGRMAFAVSTQIDSRVIIDTNGAESLIGQGDMMFKSPQTGRPIRVQGAFTATSDTENLITFIKAQIDEDAIEYKDEVLEAPEEEKAKESGSGSEYSEDTLFEDAVRIIVSSQKASSSMLQRKLRIGYNRAARLIDEMFDAKIIGPAQGSSPRKVLIGSADSFFGTPSEIENDFENTGDMGEDYTDSFE